MAKSKTYFVCSECGYESAKWMGKCPNCGNWNTLLEQLEEAEAKSVRRTSFSAVKADHIKAVPLNSIVSLHSSRVKTDIEELNRVLGGGIVKGSVVLAGGEPGIGKSTLFLQAADSLTRAGKVLYVSGEESAEQVKLRADRLKVSGDLMFLAETQLDVIISALQNERPEFLIVDSIQTIYDPLLTSAPGSVSQVRECASALARMAKLSGMAVFIIGHVTKEGSIAGPRVLEHLVDTVLYFEGERHSSFRILRAVKNRFGSTNEIGVFEMGDAGMREVKNPSSVLMGERDKNAAGAAMFCAIEGTRPVMLEIEALVAQTAYGMPRRMATGVDFNRVSLIVAVLEKKIGLKLYNQDIFVNAAGGMKLVEPAPRPGDCGKHRIQLSQ